MELRKPIEEYVGKIQAQINELRVDGTDKVVSLQNSLDNLKRDRIYTAQEKAAREAELKKQLEQAKAVETKNKDQVSKLIADAESYLKAHYNTEYYQHVAASCKEEKAAALQKYQAAVEQLKKSTRPPWPSFLTRRRSRTRNTSTKTACSTPRCSGQGPAGRQGSAARGV